MIWIPGVLVKRACLSDIFSISILALGFSQLYNYQYSISMFVIKVIFIMVVT
jgi:hypothetical protein